jgi:hypothetical protein
MHKAHISSHFFFAHFFTWAFSIQAALLWNSDSWAKYLMKQKRSPTKTVAQMISTMARVCHKCNSVIYLTEEELWCNWTQESC